MNKTRLVYVIKFKKMDIGKSYSSQTNEVKDDKRSAKLSSRTAKDAQNRHKGGAAGLVVA